jgi:hypothetical protein
MGMVSVQENREIVFVADALDDGSSLSNAYESPLALGGPNSTGAFSRRAAAATAFSPTRSEILK